MITTELVADIKGIRYLVAQRPLSVEELTETLKSVTETKFLVICIHVFEARHIPLIRVINDYGVAHAFITGPAGKAMQIAFDQTVFRHYSLRDRAIESLVTDAHAITEPGDVVIMCCLADDPGQLHDVPAESIRVVKRLKEAYDGDK